MEAIAERVISLKVSYNLRHIGGYRTRSGGVTTANILRAGSLHLLQDDGIAGLRALGVRVVVDLRSAEERERDRTPDLREAGIETIHAPVFERDASPVGLQQDFPGYATVYRQFLETGRHAYRTLFETLADTDGGFLFHCAAGKDRTGVAAALLLEVAGVPDEMIIADYAASESLLHARIDDWQPRMRERGIDDTLAQKLLASPPEDIVDTLSYVRERWGSAAGYLYDLGIAPTIIDRVRRRAVR
ncbi:MAG: hypothetical protein Kow0010_00560 [Dehalococcoidia bacterium]